MADMLPVSPFDGEGFTDEQLREQYANTTGAVAYIDESFLAPRQARGDGFYLLTAVLIDREDIVAVRAGLRGIADVEKWHTTDAGEVASERPKITRMATLLGAKAQSVVAAQMQISPKDLDAERARATCFEALLSTLCADGSLTANSLVVMERRRDGTMQKIDDTTIKMLRTKGVIHRNLAVQQSSPAWESLLWAPDVVSWAARQLLRKNETEYIKPLSGSLQIIPVG